MPARSDDHTAASTPRTPGESRPPGAALDQMALAALAGLTRSLSPGEALLAWLDWAWHLGLAPGKRLELLTLALQQWRQLAFDNLALAAPAADAASGDAASRDAGAATAPGEPLQDRRFAAPEWQQFPFNVWQQAFLMQQRWWAEATRAIPGLDPQHEREVAFSARQWLDMFSPGNHPLTNPQVIRRSLETLGLNFVRGAQNVQSDLQRLLTGDGPAGAERYRVGHEVAITPGKVILRNRVMELIQYTPTTAAVHPEPILIVPAWIMKYYILDLSPGNSLIRYLVDHGHTVFCISWKNPAAAERDLGMADYLEQGFFAALAAVNAILPKRKVHATGYCLGGTLLAIALAAMGRDGDDRLASATLLAAQTDFAEPGELALFISESQIAMLEARMAQTGYLRADQMAGAFQMLRSNDLLWSRLINHYLMGEADNINDLMAWNADATRMPARMHSEYLRQLFLRNDLSHARFEVAGHPVTLADIRLPLFMVGTLTDHVAPWRSVYKLHYLSPAEITFALTSGGHNAGIVNPPGNSKRHYQLRTRRAGGSYLAPDAWVAAATEVQGSWWPAWQQWLAARSGAPVKPPRNGIPGSPLLADAPGRYVLAR